VRILRPEPVTTAATIERYGDPDGAQRAAQAWTNAGFDDTTTARWLRAGCFDPEAARALAALEVTPEQATVRSRDGGYLGTIAHKVAAGDLTPRQGAARALSSR
jgi:hypothetical protein